jgi:hypothetical protein
MTMAQRPWTVGLAPERASPTSVSEDRAAREVSGWGAWNGQEIRRDSLL